MDMRTVSNPVVRAGGRWLRRINGAGDGGADAEPVMPVRDPAETFAEISRNARAVLPGARVRRRLFFRYTLEWTRPW